MTVKVAVVPARLVQLAGWPVTAANDDVLLIFPYLREIMWGRTARDQVMALIGEEDQVLATLRGKLGG